MAHELFPVVGIANRASHVWNSVSPSHNLLLLPLKQSLVAASCVAGMVSWIPPEIRWLFRQARPFIRWHIASFFCIALGSSLALLGPLALKWLIDEVLPGRRIGLLVTAVVLIFLCHQGKAALTSMGSYLTMLGAQRLALDLRLRLLRHLDTLSADYHEGTSLGTSVYPLKEPIEEIAYFGSDLLPAILRTLVATMLTLGTMLVLNARMTLAVLPLIPVFCSPECTSASASKTIPIRAAQSHCVEQLPARTSFVDRCHTTASSAAAPRAKSIPSARRDGPVTQSTLQNGSFVYLLHEPDHRRCHVGSHRLRRLECTHGYANDGWIGLLFTPTLRNFSSLSVVQRKPMCGRRRCLPASARCRPYGHWRPAIKNRPNAIQFPQDQPWAIGLDDVRFGYASNRGILSIAHLQIRAGEHVAVVGDKRCRQEHAGKALGTPL